MPYKLFEFNFVSIIFWCAFIFLLIKIFSYIKKEIKYEINLREDILEKVGKPELLSQYYEFLSYLTCKDKNNFVEYLYIENVEIINTLDFLKGNKKEVKNIDSLIKKHGNSIEKLELKLEILNYYIGVPHDSVFNTISKDLSKIGELKRSWYCTTDITIITRFVELLYGNIYALIFTCLFSGLIFMLLVSGWLELFGVNLGFPRNFNKVLGGLIVLYPIVSILNVFVFQYEKIFSERKMKLRIDFFKDNSI